MFNGASRPAPPAQSNQSNNMSSKVKGDAKLKAKKSVSRSSRAGLQFPVGRIHRHLKLRVTAKGRREVPCCYFLRNICENGDNCKFDHPEGGGGPKPASAKVKKCLEFSKKGRCSRGDACAFAHVAKEKVERIAADGPKPCFNWKKKGKCRKGDACKFAHS